jgi:hypothetical protein
MQAPTINRLICFFMLLFLKDLSAQNLHLPSESASKTSVHYSYLQLDINYLSYPIKSIQTVGLSVNGAAVFNDRLATGLSLDLSDSRKIPFIRDGINEPNVFEYSQFSWYNEVFFHPNSRIDVSLPIKLGLGHATVNLQDKFSFGETLFSNKNVFVEDHFFISEFGLNISVHLIRTLDLNIGSSYRFASGANGFVTDTDFFNYSIHAGLRFRLRGKH